MEPLYQLHGGDRDFIRFHSGSGEAWVLVEEDEDGTDVPKYSWKKVEEK